MNETIDKIKDTFSTINTIETTTIISLITQCLTLLGFMIKYCFDFMATKGDIKCCGMMFHEKKKQKDEESSKEYYKEMIRDVLKPELQSYIGQMFLNERNVDNYRENKSLRSSFSHKPYPLPHPDFRKSRSFSFIDTNDQDNCNEIVDNIKKFRRYSQTDNL